MWAAFALMGEEPGAWCSLRQRDPDDRGLGSSWAAIVGGVCSPARSSPAASCSRRRGSPHLAADLEGHPDNVAPAFLRRLRHLRTRGRPVVRRLRRRRPADHRGRPRATDRRRDQGRPRALPETVRTPTPRPTPGAPPCWSRPWAGSRSTCSPPPATGCTRSSASPPCRRRSRCPPPSCGRDRPSCRARARRCSRSWRPAPTWPSGVRRLARHDLAIESDGAVPASLSVRRSAYPPDPVHLTACPGDHHPPQHGSKRPRAGDAMCEGPT